MSYRPSNKPPRGAWARHLQEQRRLRDLSQTQAFELVFERIGWSPKSRTAYVAIDVGDRQPRGLEVTVLGAEFGWPPEPGDIDQDATDPLVQALREQTLAINALVAQIQAFSGPLGEVVAVWLRDQAQAAKHQPESHAASS